MEARKDATSIMNSTKEIIIQFCKMVLSININIFMNISMIICLLINRKVYKNKDPKIYYDNLVKISYFHGLMIVVTSKITTPFNMHFYDDATTPFLFDDSGMINLPSKLIMISNHTVYLHYI